MAKKENRPGGGTGTGAGMGVHRCNHSSTTTGQRQAPIADFLMEGRGNALTAGELRQILHVDRRAITRQIQEARLDGVPICASTTNGRLGYFIAQDQIELADYLRSFRHRLAEMQRTFQALNAGGAKWFAEGGADYE